MVFEHPESSLMIERMIDRQHFRQFAGIAQVHEVNKILQAI